jgi:hypothetical protein
MGIEAFIKMAGAAQIQEQAADKPSPGESQPHGNQVFLGYF